MRSDRRLLVVLGIFAAACGRGGTTEEGQPLRPAGLAPAMPAAGQLEAQARNAAQGGVNIDAAPDPDRCPPYLTSPLHRARAHTVVVGPTDDWLGAIEGAAPGTEVRLRDGAYDVGRHGSVRVGDGVTVMGRSGHRSKVVLRGPRGNGAALALVGRDAVVAGLSVVGSGGDAIATQGEAPVVYDVRLADVGGDLVRATGGADGLVACASLGWSAKAASPRDAAAVDLRRTSNWTVRDNEVYHVTGGGPAIVAWYAAKGTVIERNVLVDDDGGIALGQGQAHEGGVVRNNFVWRPWAGRPAIALDGADDALVAFNTVRIAGGAAVDVADSRGVRVVDNLLAGPIRADGMIESQGNLEDADDADFAGPEDFHLSRTSHALRRAVPVNRIGDDLDGDARGAALDVGADQRTGTSADQPAPQPQPQPGPAPEPPPPPPSQVTDFCPPYTQSTVFRRRAHQVVVGPNDDWKGAIENAAPDTEVLLQDGEYRLGGTYSVDIADDITVRGQSGDRERVIIRGQGYGPNAEALMIVGRNDTIADLSVTQVRDHAISIKGELGAQAPNIYNVHLYDTGTQHIKLTPDGVANGLVACSSIGYSPGAVRGDYIDGIDLHGAHDWVIRDNYFYNIVGEMNGCEVDISCTTYVSGPAILVWNHSQGTIIERNVLVGNYRNIALGLDRGHEGGIIRNNYIYRAGDGDAGIELRTANDTLVAHNTVRVGGYRGAIEVSNGTGVRLVNNLISAPVWDRGGAQFTEQGDITDANDADFVSPDDYHLRPGGRCVGAGVAVDGVPEDIEGQARGPRRDVGADQVSQP
jgi:hypothetical protein